MIQSLLQPDEIKARVERLQKFMLQEDIAAFLVTQHVDLYYLTGSMQAGFAFVPAVGDSTFYVRRSLARARQESCLKVEPMPSLRVFRSQLEKDYPGLFASETPIRIATEMDVLPAQTYWKLAEVIADNGHENNNITTNSSTINNIKTSGTIAGNTSSPASCSLVDGSSLIRRVRMIKSAWEIGRIEAAAAVVAEALEAAAHVLKEGITELELMARIEYEIRIRGHIGVMRTRSYNMEVLTGMLGSGEAAAIPSAFDGPAGGRGLGPAAPQSVSRKPILRGEPILIDIGCCIDGYVIDQTRTAVIGSLPDDLASAYAYTEAIIRESEQLMRPGTACDALYAAALKHVDKVGLAEHFMGFGTDQVKFLGHGIGLEVDEWPVLARSFKDPLEPGMVLAIEPKFTFPGRGVVGIENTYLITDKGFRALTQSPEGLIIIP
ncbi:Xaa-Pro aminopeptidase [Paenibacillus baekrokdamisoli]|nr:Xaa-Pro peptidase family protein [Paenibacillus baekrokdamisoli]MBB3071308.1 Xaa-Pro aminopeptidase [Paenibacillus baekrokdamisoli]